MDIMNEQDAIVLIAPYCDVEQAQRNFATLRTQLHEKRFELREALLVTKGSDGKPHVAELSSHHVLSGAGFGAGMGLLIGLAVPAFVASVAVGAAAGALVALFADHGLRSGLQHEVGQALVVGTAVIVVMTKPASRTSIERVLSQAIRVSALDFASSTIANLESAIADSMAEAHPAATTT
jgi:uncharacterized membrane protein